MLTAAAPAPGTLDLTDLPAATYLHTAVQGVPVPLYDHVVVDEAQDVAPLYYAVLGRLSRNGSFTILGDAAQSVFAYRGLASWDDLHPVFDGLPYNYQEVVDSYRSTTEIIAFANRLLEVLSPASRPPLLARPFERHGAAVQVRRLDAPADLGPALAEAVRRHQAQGFENIAIVARTAERCQALADRLAAAGLTGVLVAPAAGAGYVGGLVILPVALAKGMEFEVVLVAEADSATYPATEFDGRLIYVAATRALHALELFAAGPLNVHGERAAAG
jgi:DNA helicase-2/ATP-dependent DNA helicase PcrA